MAKVQRAAVECYYCQAAIIHFRKEGSKLVPVFKGIHTLRVMEACEGQEALMKTVLVCDDCYTNPRHRYPGAPPLREEVPRISIAKRKALARKSCNEDDLDLNTVFDPDEGDR